MSVEKIGDESAYLLIVGMHRSGTSMLTHIMVRLGYYIGKTPLEPARCNPGGFFENKRIKLFHDRLLASMSTSWSDPHYIEPDLVRAKASENTLSEFVSIVEDQYQGQAKCLIKDPRMCRLMPFWTNALGRMGIRNVRCLLPIRHPMNVARSLQARDKFTISRGLLLWIQNVLAAERDTRDIKRMVTIYDDLLIGKSAPRLADFFDLDETSLNASILQVANAKLRHQFSQEADDNNMNAVKELAFRIWDNLSKSAYGIHVDKMVLDEFWRDYLLILKSLK